jgi:predicted DNA-binding transcriptional regulator AlpA
LDSKQVAAMLGMPRRDLGRLYRAGRIPRPLPFSKKPLRWLEATLLRWLEEQQEAAYAS